VLTGRVIVPGGRAPNWATMALLFAADRVDHVEAEIEPWVNDGGIMISDRYDASSLAYQSVSSGRAGSDAVEWIRTLNRDCRRPDLTIVLDVNFEEAARRRDERGEPAQLYEQNEVDRVTLVDAGGTIDEVHERIFTAYTRAFSGPT
jgi:dTMP kinase